MALSAANARPGDVVIVSGALGDHGVAILIARNQLALEADVASDCQPLHGLVAAMLAACPAIRCLRDATRGGIATVLNEFAAASSVGIRIRETRPADARARCKGACEILGLDPLYLANEGKLVAVVPAADADRVLAAMRGASGRRRGRDHRRGHARPGRHGGDGHRVRRRAHCRHAGRRTIAADLLTMHELSIATAIVDACAERAGGARVLRVRLEIGQLAAVMPDALRFCFDVCAQGTPLEGAELDIIEIPGRGACAATAAHDGARDAVRPLRLRQLRCASLPARNCG